jgi:hypothetical protein
MLPGAGGEKDKVATAYVGTAYLGAGEGLFGI